MNIVSPPKILKQNIIKPTSSSILEPLNQSMIDVLAIRIPKSIKTHYIVLSSIIWSLAILFTTYLVLSTGNKIWLIIAIIAIIFHWISDSLDGEVGRRRKTGLITWGFYVDHVLDYCFLASISILFFFLSNEYQKILVFFNTLLISLYFQHTFQSLISNHSFHLSNLKVGPIEGKFAIALTLMFIIFMDTKYLTPILITSALSLSILILRATYKTQKKLWEEDNPRF